MNGMELSEPNEVFRMDSMIMMVQLNVRKLLEEASLPPIHIISEKLAFEGVTRRVRESAAELLLLLSLLQGRRTFERSC